MSGIISASGSTPLGVGGLLSPVTPVVAGYTARPGEFVPVSTASGPVTVTLPTAPADQVTVGVKMVAQAGGNAVTVTAAPGDAFNVAAGAASLTLSQLSQGVILQYRAVTGLWYVLVDSLSLAQLDSRYALLSGATFTGAVVPAVVTLSQSGGNVAVNAAAGNDFRLTLTASGWTISNPSSPVDGQVIVFAFAQDATGSRTVTWGTAYDFGTAGAPTLTTTASKVDVIGFKYHAGLAKWLCQGSALGF